MSEVAVNGQSYNLWKVMDSTNVELTAVLLVVAVIREIEALVLVANNSQSYDALR
jgi:hypothetical protein